MSSHPPYIMPDGRSLAAVLKEGALSACSTKQSHKKSQGRAKDKIWGQLQHSKTTANDEELAEIRAIERVGHRRRRQWLNDKLLRDLAGPMSTHDMESQFKPVPFGFSQPPSAFTLAATPKHAAVLDYFISIDSDKEAQVLQAWEAHNKQQQHHHHHRRHQHLHSALNTSGGLEYTSLHQQPQQQQHAAAAAAALAKWARVDRRARAALKKACTHTVLALEMRTLQLLEQDAVGAELQLELPDGFARLLMHGLAQYHGLQSSTCIQDGQKMVLVQQRAPSNVTCTVAGALQAQQLMLPQQQALQQSQQQPQQVPFVDVAKGAVGSNASVGAQAERPLVSEAGASENSTHSGAAAGAGAAAIEGIGTAAGWLLHVTDITCTDVIMALQELGDGLNQHTLGHYVKSMHGLISSVSCA